MAKAQDFGKSHPSFLGFRWQGALPGKITLSGSLDGSLILSSFKPSALTLARVQQWNVKAQTAKTKMSLGRLFVSWGLPIGYFDGVVIESKLLGPLGLRALAGRPTSRGEVSKCHP